MFWVSPAGCRVSFLNDYQVISYCGSVAISGKGEAALAGFLGRIASLDSHQIRSLSI
jgi:hypothetical protein